MKIIVCLKTVPRPGAVKVDPETHRLVREDSQLIINPYDRFALEMAVRLREAAGGRVVVVSMGPPQAQEALVEALGCGADEAILLSDRAFAGADTLATSYTLARAIEKLRPFDLVVCGKVAIDGETAQVGPELAQRLGIVSVTQVIAAQLKDGFLEVTRVTDHSKEALRVSLPALITVDKDWVRPRLPSLKRLLAVRGQEIPVWGGAEISADPAKIGMAGSATEVVDVFTPTYEARGDIIQGANTEEMVDRLVSILKERGLI
ncbi:electron transfer flavoprotein subunit beta/FixA family protein [Thermosulfuriphilus sp.]